MEVQGPVLLARPLPQPTPDNGARQFTTVQSLRAGQKRKRHEICLATDGDSITIYEAQNGQSVTSYTVPPTTSFCCKPCSIRISGVQGQAPTRVTYCAIKEENIKIQSFTEIAQPGQLQDSVTRSGTPRNRSDPIVYLDVVPGARLAPEDSAELDVISLQQGGLVSVLSGDLQETKWEAQLAESSGSREIRVLCAQVTTAQEASTSLLKQRMDIFGIISNNATLLAVAFTDRSDLSDRYQRAKYGLWLIDPQRHLRTQKQTATQPLLVHELPMSERWCTESKVRLEFPLKASKLFVGFATGAVNYDLTTLTPRIISDLLMEHENHDLISTIPLTSSLLVGATLESLRVYDSKYQTVQSSLDLVANTKKRKRSMGERGYHVNFIGYFSQLGRVLAIRRNDLVAFDLRTLGSDSNRRLADKPPRLADCLGRGALTQHAALSKTKLDRNLPFGKITWSSLRDSVFSDKLRATLDQMAQQQNTAGFDNLAMQEIESSRRLSDGTVHGSVTDNLATARSLNDIDIEYLISNVFQPIAPSAASPDTQLEVALLTPRLISWLSSQGLLTRHTLEKYLNLSQAKELKFQSGYIAKSLTDCDKSFALLDSYLKGCGYSDILETMEAIRFLLIEVLEQTETQPDSGVSITNSVDMEEDQSDGENGQVVPFSAAGQQAAPSNANFLDQGARDSPARRSLILAMSCLAGYGLSSICSKLGSTFNPSDILSLIQFLRQELFYGGYTSSSQGRPDVQPSDRQLSLNSIVKLLSGCIDALGPVALFTLGENDGFIESMIPDLRSEIARALEAVAEATGLQGILRETLRYADSASQLKGTNDPAPMVEDNILSSQKPGTILTLYSEPQLERGNIEATGGMLPLSLRVDDLVSKTKMRKGGGQVTERSAREIHMLQARAKGRYAFERLVL